MQVTSANNPANYHRPQTKFAKVMFLQVSVCPHRGEGGVHGFIGVGACMVLFGGACVVLFGGACVVLFGGHAWFYSGGMHGCIRGACVVFSMRYGQ